MIPCDRQAERGILIVAGAITGLRTEVEIGLSLVSVGVDFFAFYNGFTKSM